MSYCEDIFLRSLRLVISDDEMIIRNYKADWLINPNTGKKLEYDFYLPNFKIAFEIQGITHYIDEDQKERDNIKKELSEKEGVILFCISPNVIRNKLVARSFTVFRNFHLKPFDQEKIKNILEEIKSYKQQIKNKYGFDISQRSPLVNECIIFKNSVKKYLKSKEVFYFNINGIIQKCRIIELRKSKVVVKLVSGKIEYIKYSYFKNLVY